MTVSKLQPEANEWPFLCMRTEKRRKLPEMLPSCQNPMILHEVDADEKDGILSDFGPKAEIPLLLIWHNFIMMAVLM